jgi:hypothetical protein
MTRDGGRENLSTGRLLFGKSVGIPLLLGFIQLLTPGIAIELLSTTPEYCEYSNHLQFLDFQQFSRSWSRAIYFDAISSRLSVSSA